MSEFKYSACINPSCRNTVTIKGELCESCKKQDQRDKYEDHHERRERTDQEQDDAGHKNSDFA